MNTQEKNYRKQVRKALLCGRKEKKQLTAALDRDLARFREETPEPTAEELSAAFGTPVDMAASLMAQLPGGTAASYRKKTQMITWVVSVVMAVILLFSVYACFIKEIPVYEVEDLDIGESWEVPDRTGE